MFKKLPLILSFLVLLPIVSCEEIGLTAEQVIAGLKEALTVGTENSVTSVNKIDGYFNNIARPGIKILFPEEAQIVEDVVSSIPLIGQPLVDNFVLNLNRAAEDAASFAKPIFINAITSITIEDAFGILKGTDDAATQYLKSKTFNELKNAFKPSIENSLESAGANDAWNEVISKYNSLPGSEPVTTDLPEYATTKALDGLFVLVADEELKIRNDPAARVSEILQTVFGEED